METGLDKILRRTSGKHWLEQVVEEALVKAEREKRVSEKFHPSWAGKCPRLIQFTMNGLLKDEVEPKLQRIFDVGSDMHLRYKRYFQRANKFEAEEIPIEISINNITIVGRADLVIKDYSGNKHVIEMKSMNNRRFTELLSVGAPVEENFLQWNIYSRGLDIPEGEILYENKDDQRLKIFSVEFSQPKFDDIIEQFEKIDKANRSGILVEKPATCDSYFCAGKNICFQKK